MIKDKIVDHRFSVKQFHSSYDYNWDSQFSFAGESHDFWEMVYVAFGSVVIVEDARVYSLKQGDMILHRPMEFHNIRSANASTPHVQLFTFSADGALPEKLASGVFSLTKVECDECERLFEKVLSYFDDYETDEFTGMECALGLTNFLITVCRGHDGKRQLVESGSAREYRRLVKSMTAHVNDNFALEQFAKECAISVSYMKVLFGRYAGISPKAYYARLRCSEAIRLLEEGYTATQVADCMGFSSPNYFSAFFKRMTGMPPSHYHELKKAEE
ncbi:MAG: helix-turn-helix transcriptional regulator [Clostridia bacterium]|nr:helix-turn-helix transcriptional regulator [Clostridia bacterium]